MKTPFALPLTSSALAIAALAGAHSAQDGACAKPGLDAEPASYPYGPVDPDDGVTDWIDVQSNVPLDFRFSLAGLDHDQSLPLSPNYLTMAMYSSSIAEVPLLLNPCAFLQLPTNAPLVVIPSSLEAPAQVNIDGAIGTHTDLFMQALSIDVTDPALPLEMSDLARVRFRQGPTVPDPTTDSEYGCYYWGYYVWDLADGVGPVEGRIYWPNACDGTQQPPKSSPLVLLVHGDGHDYTDYHYLMRHLAFNGYIAATINGGWGKSNVERSERVRTYLSFIRNNWEHKNFVENNIALMGHSRGGEAVFTAARKLKNDWGTDHDINAVIALAPTDNDEDDGLEGLESLSGLDSESLLVIYGSQDEDVAGYCTSGTALDCGQFPFSPQATGFSLYDRAGGEGSTDGVFIASDAIQKSMLFVQRADHNRWRDQPCVSPGIGINPPLNCEEHHDTLMGYTNAFLRWQLSGQDDYKPFFTGEWTPQTVADHDIDILTQYSDAGGRRVIDNFESGPWNDATLGDVTKELQVTVVKKGSLYNYGNFTAPHDTDGIVLRWSTHPLVIEPWIRWTIPAGSGLFTGEYRDFSGFSALSMRVGQMDDASSNPSGEPQNFYVRMRDGNGVYSPKVSVNAFTDLSYPHQSNVVTPLFQLKSTAKSALRTARIPLSYFSGIDLTEIVDVELVFGDNDHLQGEILLDSLELVP
ncbi:MAG: hypothetical protein AAF682_17380 [Planctomycetota bacterium]